MRAKAIKAATATCMLRLVRGRVCRASTARPAASVSLLERIRDVVLRLIMLSAVSRASVQRTTSSVSGSSKSSKASSRRASGRNRGSEASVAVACRREDSIRNEAVEDCIEFLKRSSAEGDAAKLSSVRAVDAKLSGIYTTGSKLSAVGSEDKAFFVLNIDARRESSPAGLRM